MQSNKFMKGAKFEFSNKVSPPITVRCCDSVPSSSCKVTSMKGTQIQAFTKLGMNLAFRGSLDLFPALFVKYSNISFLLLVSDYPIDLTQFRTILSINSNFCNSPNCQYHILVYSTHLSSSDFSLQGIFSYQIVGCLFTVFIS